MRHWPVWNEVFSCKYGGASAPGSKSYGVRETGEVTVKFGTSKANSETLIRHFTTVRQSHCGLYTVYRFGYELPGVYAGRPVDHHPANEPVVIVTRYMRNKDRQIMPPGFDPATEETEAAA